MPIAYQFLPWVRRGLAVALDVPDNLGVGAPLAARGSAEVGVKLVAPHDGTAIAPLPMRLHGPGDVIGIDQRLVVRTDPKANATNFEPNYLAHRRLRSAGLSVDAHTGESAGRSAAPSMARVDRARGHEDGTAADVDRWRAAVDPDQGRRCRERVAGPRGLVVVGALAVGERRRGPDSGGPAGKTEQQHLAAGVSHDGSRN